MYYMLGRTHFPKTPNFDTTHRHDPGVYCSLDDCERAKKELFELPDRSVSDNGSWVEWFCE